MDYTIKRRYKSKRSLCKLFILVCAIVFFAGINISVTQAAAKINMTECTLFVGDDVELKVTGYKGKIKWKSSKKNIASVYDGEVRAEKAGKTVITAKCGNKTLKCKLTVLKEKKYSYESNTLTLTNGGISPEAYVGDMYDFASYDNGSYYIDRRDEGTDDEMVWKTYDKELYDGEISDAEKWELITWSSSDESVAKVTQEGLVFFNKPGYVTITAKTASKQAKVGFNVRSAIPTLKEKRQILKAVAKRLKKAGAKKVLLGVTDESERWEEYEQSAYSQIYGGRHLSKAAYVDPEGGAFGVTLCNADDLDEDFLKQYSGETVTIYYRYSFGGSMLELYLWQ